MESNPLAHSRCLAEQSLSCRGLVLPSDQTRHFHGARPQLTTQPWTWTSFQSWLLSEHGGPGPKVPRSLREQRIKGTLNETQETGAHPSPTLDMLCITGKSLNLSES